STAWVAPVTGAGGTELVLKVAWAHDESRDEAAGMAVWQGWGAARLLHAELRGQSSLLLMERVRPGTPLSQSLSRTAREEVVGADPAQHRSAAAHPDVRMVGRRGGPPLGCGRRCDRTRGAGPARGPGRARFGTVPAVAAGMGWRAGAAGNRSASGQCAAVLP